jgi:cobaltochelatase CobT
MNKNSQINKTKDDLAATIQAIVADDSLRLEFSEDRENNFFTWKENLLLDGKKILLPEIHDDDNRAAADMAACYLLFHDRELHQNKNFNLEEQNLFDEFEKIRVFINAKDCYLGVVKNILAKIEKDLSSKSFANQALPLLLLNSFFESEILFESKNLILDLEKNLNKDLIKEIKNLSKKIYNQEAYALGVVKIIEILQKEENANEINEKDQPEVADKKDDVNYNQENIEANDDKNDSASGVEDQESQALPKENSELKMDESAGKIKARIEKQNFEEDKIEYKNPYKIYSSKFDEVIFPQKLIAKNELEILRHQLDLKIAKLGGISKKMSLKLKRKLLAKKDFYLERDNNSGILDRKKLVRLAIDPMLEDIWVRQKNNEYNDTALTILLDNSGSMRGNPIVMSALVCETIAEILEKFAIKTEIIGFTTGDWKGGRVRKLWELSGKTPNPGRLNELRHIIYKSFNQKFKKAKVNLGLMLKEGVLKENIDGEALLFARLRLMQQDQKRKILIVISDGTPVDDSTNSTNDGDILSEHLLTVVNNIEKKSQIEIVGIGIGHATDDFYKNSIAVKSLDDLGDAMIEKIVNLL